MKLCQCLALFDSCHRGLVSGHTDTGSKHAWECVYLLCVIFSSLQQIRNSCQKTGRQRWKICLPFIIRCRSTTTTTTVTAWMCVGASERVGFVCFSSSLIREALRKIRSGAEALNWEFCLQIFKWRLNDIAQKMARARASMCGKLYYVGKVFWKKSVSKPFKSIKFACLGRKFETFSIIQNLPTHNP